MHANVPVRFGRGRLDSLGNKGLAAYLIAGDLVLRAEVERTGAYKCATPRSADNPRTVSVILECKDACENTELPPLNGIAHLPGPHSESYVSEKRHGRPWSGCSGQSGRGFG
jgi:hypothetical protein